MHDTLPWPVASSCAPKIGAAPPRGGGRLLGEAVGRQRRCPRAPPLRRGLGKRRWCGSGLRPRLCTRRSGPGCPTQPSAVRVVTVSPVIVASLVRLWLRRLLLPLSFPSLPLRPSPSPLPSLLPLFRQPRCEYAAGGLVPPASSNAARSAVLALERWQSSGQRTLARRYVLSLRNGLFPQSAETCRQPA